MPDPFMIAASEMQDPFAVAAKEMQGTDPFAQAAQEMSPKPPGPGMSLPSIDVKPVGMKEYQDLTNKAVKETLPEIPKRLTLPVVGVAAGTILGGPVGGALGGMSGEVLQQLYERYILKEDLSARDMLIRQGTALIAGGMNPEILANKFPLAFGNKAEAVGAKLTGPAMRDESAVTLLPKPNKEEPMMRLAPGRRETAVTSGPRSTERVFPATSAKAPSEEFPVKFEQPGSKVHNNRITFDKPGASVNPPKDSSIEGVENSLKPQRTVDVTPEASPELRQITPIERTLRAENPGGAFELGSGTTTKPVIRDGKIVMETVSNKGDVDMWAAHMAGNKPAPTIEKQIAAIADDAAKPVSSIPGDFTSKYIAELRPMDEFLNKSGHPEITAPIYKASAVGEGFVEEFNGRIQQILKGVSKEDQAAIIRIREGRGSYEETMRLREKAEEVRKWFDDLFNVVDDPELKAAIGKDFKYTEGYIPMLSKEYGKVAKAPEDVAKMLGATERASGLKPSLTPKQMVTQFLNKRRGILPDEKRVLDLDKLMKTYLYGIKKTTFDIPAYEEAMGILKTIPEGEFKKQASWYLNNYIGQPSVLKDSGMMQASTWLRNRMYTALIGLKTNVPLLNLSQSGLTAVETGIGRTAKGIGKAFTPSARGAAKDAGYFREYPGTEGSIKSKVDQIANFMMEQAERINRTTSREAGLSLAKSRGLAGADSSVTPGSRAFYNEKFGNPAAMDAWNTTRKTQFMYGKESPIRFSTEHPLLSMFTSYPLKNAEFQHGVIKDALTKGGAENWGKLARLAAYDTIAGAGISSVPFMQSPISQYATRVKQAATNYASANGKDKEKKLVLFEKVFKESWRYFMPAGDVTVRALEKKK
jgi:hypothetical protein